MYHNLPDVKIIRVFPTAANAEAFKERMRESQRKMLHTILSTLALLIFITAATALAIGVS